MRNVRLMRVIVQDKKKKIKKQAEFGRDCIESKASYLRGKRLVCWYGHVFICVSRKPPAKRVRGQLTDPPYLSGNNSK